MKKILYMFALVAMVFATACSKESDLSREGQGAVTFALSNNMTRNSPVAPSLLDMVKDKLMFRIYSVANTGEQTEAETLVRLYTYDEIIGDGSAPMQIWLLAGDYRVRVEGGEKSEASFTDIYYKGATDFKVEEAMTDQQIEIECRPANVMVKVVFDESVAQNMGTTGKATIAFAEADSYTAVEGDIVSKSIPSLTYSQTMTGYYYPLSGDAMPSKFVWRFAGTVATKDNAAVTKDGVYAPAEGSFKAGYMYTLTFKYSPDLGGYLTLNVTVDDMPDEYSNTATFKPEPQFDSSIEVEQGYENVVGEVAQMYSGKKVGYNIKAISAISELKISVDGNDLTYSASAVNATTRGEETAYAEYKDAANGVTIRVLNDKEWNLLLEPAFSQKLGAGKQEFVLTVTDESAAQAEYVQEYIGEGVSSLTITAGKEWEGEATFKANIFNPEAGAVTLYYKESADSGEYKSAPLSNDSATVTGLRGGRIYDAYVAYALADQSTISTPHAALSTPNGKQIPNGGMETWSGGTPRLPYDYNALGAKKDEANVSTTWDSGNHGSAMASTNLTTDITDLRPGSKGSRAAQLQSKKATVMGIGKFAAGNIFFGRYVKTSGTNGVIDFGQPFTFDYKPDKLVVWYKGNVGTINEVGDGSPVGSGSSDKAQIYVWLCNSSNRYRIQTGKDTMDTFITPDGKYVQSGQQVPGLVAYGYWNRTQTESQINGVTVDMSYAGWTKIEIPLVYINDAKPTMLVISCAASAYGDYFTGSTSSVMCLDDFEFVY